MWLVAYTAQPCVQQYFVIDDSAITAVYQYCCLPVLLSTSTAVTDCEAQLESSQSMRNGMSASGNDKVTGLSMQSFLFHCSELL